MRCPFRAHLEPDLAKDLHMLGDNLGMDSSAMKKEEPTTSEAEPKEAQTLRTLLLEVRHACMHAVTRAVEA